jgi:acetate---CoA ligase (ADP-forming)
VSGGQHSLADAIFAPRTIALIGASGDPGKNTSRPQRFLRKHGYTGRIVPVNPGRDEIFGEKAYPDLLAVPGEIDHAYIMVPGSAVKGVLEQCVARKVTVATIYSDGFADAGAEGKRKQDELFAVARAGGVRLIGPNCIGIFSIQPPCALSAVAVLEMDHIKPGSVGLISQSGSMTGALLSRGQGRGFGFSKLVSVGNEADLGVGEFTDMLVDDPHTSVILLFLETLRDADRLAHAARRAYARGKPVIVYKLGRSEAGKDLAASHTGAMAGADEVADAFFRAHGMLRVNMVETLLELPALVNGQKPAHCHRVGVMTTSGGGAASVVDPLGSYGVDVVGPSQPVIAELAAKNLRIGNARLIDLTMAGARKEVYSAVLDALLRSRHCDLVLAVAGSSAQFQPQVTIEPILEADRSHKPLAVFCAPHAEASLTLLAQHGVAAFRTAESCADAIRAWKEWRAPDPAVTPDHVQVDAAARLLAGADAGRLNEHEACRVFAALGIRVAPSVVIREPGDPCALAFPVAAKVLSPDIAHKTDAGAVCLNLASCDELESACREIVACARRYKPDARIDGILVQSMERGLAEAIVGFKRDPQVGPIVALGVGGILAEIYKDFAIRLAPVGIPAARAMVEEVQGLAIIRGFRGMPRGDCEALAAAVCAMSQLALVSERTVAEAEVNPLIVKRAGEGGAAVDGLIRLAPDCPHYLIRDS